jgi:hypothetical protein
MEIGPAAGQGRRLGLGWHVGVRTMPHDRAPRPEPDDLPAFRARDPARWGSRSRQRLSLLLTPSTSSTLKFGPARSMMAGMLTLILTGLLFALRTQRALVLENLALRHQLAVLHRTAPRPRLRPSDRMFWVLLARLWRGWAEAVAIV